MKLFYQKIDIGIWRIYVIFWPIQFQIARLKTKKWITIGVMMILGMEINQG